MDVEAQERAAADAEVGSFMNFIEDVGKDVRILFVLSQSLLSGDPEAQGFE